MNKEVGYFLNYIFLKMFCVKDGNYYFPYKSRPCAMIFLQWA